MSDSKSTSNFKNNLSIIRDDEDFLIVSPFTHEENIATIEKFQAEMNVNEIPEWFHSCLTASNTTFFNLMYFTYSATLYYVLVRSALLKEKLSTLGINKFAFLFGVTIPQNQSQINQLIKAGCTRLDEEKWITSNFTFNVHGRVPPTTAVDKDILEILDLAPSTFKIIPITTERIKTHVVTSKEIIEKYVEGDLDLSSKPINDEDLAKIDKPITGNLYLQFTNLSTLPDNLSVKKGLYVQYTQLKKLPKNLKVGEKINLNNTNITTIPLNFVCNGSLLARHCNIKKLPVNLYVKGNLDLESSALEEMPQNLTVQGSLNIQNTPLAKKVNEENLRVFFPNVQKNIYY